MARKFSILILALFMALNIITNVNADENNPNVPSENDLIAILKQNTSEDINHVVYDDFDYDGNYEAFIFTGEALSPDGIGMTAWFVSKNGVIQLVDDWYLYSATVLDHGDSKHVKFHGYARGTVAWVYGVVENKAIEYITPLINFQPRDEELIITVNSYDGVYDPTTMDYWGSSWEPDYYVFWDKTQKKYGEYGGIKISLEQLLMFEGATDILNNHIYNNADRRITEIFYRGNGVIHMNYEEPLSDKGWIAQNNLTLRYDDTTIRFVQQGSGKALQSLMETLEYDDAVYYITYPKFKAPSNQKVQPFPLGIHITWQPSDNPKGYNIYRSEAIGEKGTRINTNPIFGSEYIDANVDSNTTYYYTISAISADGQTDTPINDIGQMEAKTEKITSGITGSRGFILMQIGKETMIVNGEVVEIDPGRGTTPLVKNGRTLLPIRAVIEAMNGNVGWHESESKVAISALEHNLEMWLGKEDMTVDGESAMMDIPPEAINGRTMLPLRFVAESIGCLIEWIGTTKEVIIVYPL